VENIGQLRQSVRDAQSLVATNTTKNAMLGHSLFLKSGRSWIVFKQCACL
jgi:hypothetical protein